jgi:hypothetical protein
MATQRELTDALAAATVKLSVVPTLKRPSLP